MESKRTNETQAAGRGPVSRARRLYRWLLFCATIAAVTWFIARNIGQMRRFDFRFDWRFLAAAFLSISAGLIARFAAWMRLSKGMTLEAPVAIAARAYFLSNLGRYVPGKLGLALVRIEAYGNHPAGLVLLATAVELICAVSAAFILAFVGFSSTTAYLTGVLRWLPLACIVPLLAILSPPVIRRIAAATSRVTGAVPFDRIPRFREVLVLVGLYVLPGLLQGFGLFCVLNAFVDVPASQYLALTGAYYAANLAGVVAVFAPGGIGVREGVLFLILPALVGKEASIIAAITARFVTLAAELILGGASAVAARSRRG
ncbi:MAG: hypothetical protein NTW97_00915 [Candidatus Krumholzibacteria bacterium]|nr:hypothetical protein [Candidatus Krumholzibacteria bacterium]